MGFKEDADFGRYLSMGAIATDAVRTDLKRYGHNIVELERFAMSNKVWQTRVKRMRLPDLLCTNCGLRVESRGKSELGIIVSHSQSDNRGWEGGMRENDLFAFLRVSPLEGSFKASPPIYFTMRDLRAAREIARESARKAFSEGAEVTLEWNSWVPKNSGTLVGIDDREYLLCEWDNGGSYTYWQWREWEERHTYIRPGDRFVGGETMVAGTVPAAESPTCAGDWDLETALSDPDVGERYAGVKAAGILQRSDLFARIALIAHDEEDWRLRLEAAASLARMDPGQMRPIVAAATDPDRDEAERIEAVFVLSEIPTDEAAEALATIASDRDGPSELRAAAVWSLARGVRPKPELVLQFAADSDDLVALHSIVGLPDLPDSLIPGLVKWLEGDDRQAAAAAQILRRHTAVAALLTSVQGGGRARLWALRALGDLPPAVVRSSGKSLLTAEIERDLEPIWIGLQDWLRTNGADGLAALDVQTIRFDPLLD